MNHIQRIEQLEKDIALLNHNLDEALTMIAQTQQAILENDEKLSNAHDATGRIAKALLNFWKAYEVPSVK